jgi:hypothetical protein
MARGRRPPSQGWKTFLRNHADGIASMDLFVVPTISFRLLYGFLVLRHARREILWLGVTAHPSAQWIARQLSEAYGWQQAPQYIVRDRDCVYGDAFIRRVRAMGIRDRPITSTRTNSSSNSCRTERSPPSLCRTRSGWVMMGRCLEGRTGARQCRYGRQSRYQGQHELRTLAGTPQPEDQVIR